MADVLPTYPNDHLATLSEQQLIDLMIGDEDRVPRNVIDECAGRGAAIQIHFSALLSEQARSPDDFSDGEWWLRHHAIMILGLIATEAAALQLLAFMSRISNEDDDDLQDWLAGRWPALFGNKPLTILGAVRELAMDRGGDWYIRAQAIEVAVALSHSSDSEALEQALAWLVQLIEDPTQDDQLRLSAADTLLNFPRAQYRTLLETMSSGLNGDVHFYLDEVDKIFETMEDTPPWDIFADPWSFYSHERIQQRQERWTSDDDDFDFDNDLALFADEEYDYQPSTFVRETPKIGRNDPCPCGSRKKYKKCCLAAEGR